MSSTKAKLSFYGGVGIVTGANFVLDIEGKLRLAVDCGLIQGSKFAQEENRKPFGYDPASVEVLLITHAHMDHVGRIPKFVKDGFRGVIYSTVETRDIALPLLHDALGLLTRDAQDTGVEPLYTEEHLNKAFELWKTIPYHSSHDIGKGVFVYLRDAGHILGSSMIEIKVGDSKRNIVFTGDLGNSPAPLLHDTEDITGATYMVIESVYGDRNHEPQAERQSKLETILRETIAKKGAVIIPAFSVERSQVILYEINNLVEEGKIPSVPVFLDSPLGIKVTEIYKKYRKDFNEGVQKEIAGGDDIFNFPKLQFVVAQRDSKQIEQTQNPKIIIAGSGMSVGGRVISHEMHHLKDPNSTILFVGYQSAGSLGRQIEEGAKVVHIHGEEVRVNARVEKIGGYSSHKDSDHLVEFVEKTATSLESIFVAMGEAKSSLFLVQRLKDYLGVNALYPEQGKSFDINL